MATYHLSVKSGSKGAASNHARYIAREGTYRRKEEDLVAHWSGNLPPWCAGNPKVFWQEADRSERKNAAVYREYEASLPFELTTGQQIELVKEVIQQVCANKPYEVAIHSPQASLGDVAQPHFHLMYSDRIDDGIARGPAQHFRRFNSVNPGLGGCKKDSGGRSPLKLREELRKLRGAFADLTNEALARNGHLAVVDHRSNKDRGIEREPGRHLGSYKVSQLKNGGVLAPTGN